MIKKICYLLGMLIITSIQASAESPSVDLQAKLSSIHTLSANFTQEVRVKNRRLATSSGRMVLSRPGLFRWQTNQPSEQLVIADGQHIWVYDKELEQVSVKKQSQSLGGAAALFLNQDPSAVSRDFDVTKQDKISPEIFLLRARSAKATFEKVQLAFDQQRLSEIILYDQLGQRTTIKLSAVKTNQKLDAKLFHFKPPKGVDVVQQ